MRALHFASAGYIVVTGGYWMANDTRLSSVEVLTLSTNVWSDATDMLLARAAHGSAYSRGDAPDSDEA